MRKIVISSAARIDLTDCCEYLDLLDPNVAMLFFDSARLTFADIARMPFVGKVYRSSHPKLQDLRRWRIKEFSKYLIFYRVQDDLIEIVRILHGSQDIESVLTGENDS